MRIIRGKLSGVRVRKTRDPASLRPPRHEAYFYHYELDLQGESVKMVFHNKPQDFEEGQELCLAVFETILGQEAFAYKNVASGQVVHTGFIIAEMFWGVACLGGTFWFFITSFTGNTFLLWRLLTLVLAALLLLGARHYLIRGSRTLRAVSAVSQT
jgi:hypothetical protein